MLLLPGLREIYDDIASFGGNSDAIYDILIKADLSQLPVLGSSWTLYQTGFGTVRPRNVFNGGDPTGALTGITWSTWGGATATGHGTGDYEAAGQSVADSRPAPAQVEAFDLGTCKGKPAYLRIQWWFPQHGEKFDPSTGNGDASYNICTGGPADESTASACPTKPVVTAAFPRADQANIKSVSRILCSGTWSAIEVNVAVPGSDDGTGQEVVNEETDVLQETAAGWALRDRATACKGTQIPTAIHHQACDGN